VVGGYNSSNTSHIVELLSSKFPTYFISDERKILSGECISHFDISDKTEIESDNFIPDKKPVKIVLTSGASCPDALVDQVLQKLLKYFDNTKEPEDVIKLFT